VPRPHSYLFVLLSGLDTSTIPCPGRRNGRHSASDHIDAQWVRGSCHRPQNLQVLPRMFSVKTLEEYLGVEVVVWTLPFGPRRKSIRVHPSARPRVRGVLRTTCDTRHTRTRHTICDWRRDDYGEPHSYSRRFKLHSDPIAPFYRPNFGLQVAPAFAPARPIGAAHREYVGSREPAAYDCRAGGGNEGSGWVCRRDVSHVSTWAFKPRAV